MAEEVTSTTSAEPVASAPADAPVTSSVDTPSTVQVLGSEAKAPATPTPVASVPETPPAAPSLDPSIADHLKQYGINPEQFQQPTQVVDFALQAAIQAQQEYQRMQSEYQALQRQLQQQTAPVPQQQQAVAEPNASKAPEFNKDWMQFVKWSPEEGLYVPKVPGAVSPDVVAKVNNYAAWKVQEQQKREADPVGYMLENGLNDRLKEIEQRAVETALQRIQQQTQQQQIQQTAQNIVQQNMEWAVQRDAAGNPMFNAQGEYLYTPQGMQYINTLNGLRQNLGIQGTQVSPQQLDYLARAVMAYEQSQQATQANPANRAQAFAGAPQSAAAALHNPSRNGANSTPVAGSEPAPVPGSSFLQLALQDARMAGKTISGTVQTLV